MNCNLKKLINTKNLNFKKYLKSKQQKHLDEYKKSRNIVNRETKNLKNEFFCNKFKTTDPKKKTWSTINSLLKPQCDSSQIKTIKINDTNNITSNDLEIANELNNFFVNICKTIVMQPQLILNPT